MKTYNYTCDACDEKIEGYREFAENVHIRFDNCVIEITIKGDLCEICALVWAKKNFKGEVLREVLKELADHRVPLP